MLRPMENEHESRPVKGTSVGERGAAEVTAATTASSPSNHRTNKGRFFEPLPLVKGMSATQNSPGWIGIV